MDGLFISPLPWELLASLPSTNQLEIFEMQNDHARGEGARKRSARSRIDDTFFCNATPANYAAGTRRWNSESASIHLEDNFPAISPTVTAFIEDDTWFNLLNFPGVNFHLVLTENCGD